MKPIAGDNPIKICEKDAKWQWNIEVKWKLFHKSFAERKTESCFIIEGATQNILLREITGVIRQAAGRRKKTFTKQGYVTTWAQAVWKVASN